MADTEDEGIFQINDYTQYTEFEVLTNNIELYMRENGFSVEIPAGLSKKPSNEFCFHDLVLKCEKKSANRPKPEASEPVCVHEMWDDNAYPFLSNDLKLSQWFGFNEFFAVSGEDVEDGDESVLLSAFAVGALNAKCTLPVLTLNEAHKGMKAKAAQGLLLFPGLYVSFQVWNLGNKYKSDPKLRGLKGYPDLVNFFGTTVEPGCTEIRATAFSDYLKLREPKQLFNLIEEVHIYCKWENRPAKSLIDCYRAGTLDPARSSHMRIKLVSQSQCDSASVYAKLLTDPMQRDRPLRMEPLSDSVRESVYFDEFLRMLGRLFPIFPMNSFWTKITIDQLFDAGTFSAAHVKEMAGIVGLIAENGKGKVSPHSDFRHFSSYAKLHQNALIALAAAQCLQELKHSQQFDTCARMIFLHLSPSKAEVQRLVPPENLEDYQRRVVTVVLRAFRLDRFIEKGVNPSASEFAEWHRTTLRDFEYYQQLCGQWAEGQAAALWETVAAESIQRAAECVKEELLKEQEMAVEALKCTSLEEISKLLPGLCVCSVLTLTFKRQIALLNESQSSHLTIPAIQELLRPAFREFRSYCHHLPNFRCMDSVVVEEVYGELAKLETAISRVFAVCMHFAEDRALVARLLKSDEVEVTGAERETALKYLADLGAPLQSQVVLRTDCTRLSWSLNAKGAHLALAKVVRERQEL